MKQHGCAHAHTTIVYLKTNSNMRTFVKDCMHLRALPVMDTTLTHVYKNIKNEILIKFNKL